MYKHNTAGELKITDKNAHKRIIVNHQSRWFRIIIYYACHNRHSNANNIHNMYAVQPTACESVPQQFSNIMLPPGG